MEEKRPALIVGCDDLRPTMIGYVADFFSIIEACGGADARAKAEACSRRLSIIFIGLSAPDDEGVRLIAELNRSGMIRRVPVIVFTPRSDLGLERYAYEQGITEYISPPFDPEIVKIKLRNILGHYRYKDELEEEHARHLSEAMDNHRNTLDFLANVIEARNMENGEHVSRVKGMARILAEQVMNDCPSYGLTKEKISLISDASALHDLGKIMIRESVLLKPGRLTEEEAQYMKRHTIYGCLLLNKMKNMLFEDFFETCYDICRYHHEKVDGSGYPDGLCGDAIPISAQIVSVADCFDALTASRPYKPAYPARVAYKMIMDGECGVFAPELLAAFRRCRARMMRLTEQSRH